MQYAYMAGSDFRSIRNKYSTAVANGAYVYPYTDKNGDQCIFVYVNYKIISNYHAYFLHNITKGTRIEDPANYYSRLANNYWGASKIHYLDLAIDANSAAIKALNGFVGKNDEGYFVGASTLNL